MAKQETVIAFARAKKLAGEATKARIDANGAKEDLRIAAALDPEGAVELNVEAFFARERAAQEKSRNAAEKKAADKAAADRAAAEAASGAGKKKP